MMKTSENSLHSFKNDRKYKKMAIEYEKWKNIYYIRSVTTINIKKENAN